MLTATDRKRLMGFKPEFVLAYEELDRRCELAGCAILVAQGGRTAAYQATLYAQGRTTPGPRVRPGHPLGSTVTNCDGYKTPSNHQAGADGFYHAIDFAFVDDPKTPKSETYDEAYWARHEKTVWAIARELGFKLGADWTHPDRPHLEML